MKSFKIINPRNVSEEEIKTYSLRDAARAVVVDKDNKIALIQVIKEGYYMLPGGGLEKDENTILGVKRECREEIGCEVEVISEIGSTLEYWKENNEKQTSYGFLAKVIGEKGTPDFTEEEKGLDLNVVWVTHSEAVNFLKQSQPNTFRGEYIVARELAFLEKVRTTLL